MTYPSKYLTAFMLSAALSGPAAAGPVEECMQQAAKSFHPGTTYLGHKAGMIGTSVAFSVPKTLELPSSAAHGLVPVFKNSSVGILMFNTEMSSLYFYDRPVSSVTRPGENFSENNFDAIGALASTLPQEKEEDRPLVDSAKSATLTPQTKKLHADAQACLKVAP